MTGINVHLWPAMENVMPQGIVTNKTAALRIGSAFTVVLGVAAADEAWLRTAATVLDEMADDLAKLRLAESTAGETRDVPTPGGAV